MPVFQLGDRALVWIVVVRDVAVAERKDTHVEVTGGDIGQTLVEWPLVGGHVVLHRDYVMAKLAEYPVDLLAVLLQVAICGGDIDPYHCRAPLTTDNRA